MEEEKYIALLKFLQSGEYPPGFSKNQKYILSFSDVQARVMEASCFSYVDLMPDRSTFNGLVLRGKAEVERLFNECHASAGGHRGRDATVSKVKARLAHANYYKDIEERVSNSCCFNL